MQITFGDSIYSLDGEIYNSTFDFTDSTITINSLGSSVSLAASAAVGDTFDVLIDNQNVRAINDSVSAAFDSTIDYYALGDDSTLTAVTGTTKINDIELITTGNLTVTGKHYDLDDGSSYNLAQTITGLSGGDSITVNDLWSDATFAYYVSDDGTTISRISDDSIVYTGSADTLSSLNFGTISFMDYFTQTVGEVVDAFNIRYAAFDGTTLTIDAKTLKTNLDTQITAAQSELASAATITSTLVIDKMDDIIKSVISSDVGIKNLLNEDMYNAMSSQIDSILSAGGNPLDIFSTLDDYNGDIFSWICDSLVVPTAQILGTSTLERLAANLSNRLSSYGTSTIILNGSADTISIGAYYGDSIDASSSTMENLIIAGGEVTDSPQKDLVLLTGNNTHSGSIQNAIVLGKTDSAATVTGDLVEQGIYINGIHYDLGSSNTNQFITTIGGEDMTITAATLSGSSAFSSDDSGVISISAADGASVGLTLTLDDLGSTVPVTADFTLSGGSLVYNPQSSNFSLSEGSAISFSRDDQVITLTTTEDTSATCKVEEDIYYMTLDNEVKANISISNAGQSIFDGDLETGGVWSYRPDTGTFGLTGASSSHGNGTNTFVQLTYNNSTFRAATNNTTIVLIPTYTDGIFKFNFPNEAKNAMLFTLSGNGETFFENNVSVDGTINLDIANQELSLTKDTEFKVNFGDDYTITIKATDDAGGKLTFTDDGVRFAPNTGDGDLELSFDGTDRKANLDIDGAIVFGADGKITLEDGTEVNLTWEDGSTLKLTSSGSTGSIAFGTQGLKITSDDENLDLELTMAYGYSTKISGLKGSLWYNAGKVVLDEGTKLTGTGTLGANTVNVTLETIDGNAQLDFSTSTGFVYGAGTGKLKVTYALGNRKSTFTVNEGSVLFGNGISEIAEGTDLETDLQNFMPALNLTTTDAGTYTINGQTITTSAANIAMTATDNYISFMTNDNVVTHEGMTFAGDGTVSLSAAGVILGAGVVATGFGEGESFILAEAGDVTADARIFELSNIEGTPREIPMIITVTGAQDGFTFSRTLTKESEAYLDDALDDENFENYTSPYIGKVFTEQFISAGDNSYRIRTDAIGLEEVIGISDGATITGGAVLADEPTLSYYNLVTDTEGSFTIGEKTYNLSGDSSVAIRARFEPDTAPYASYFDSLNGTVSGDFTGGQFSINQKPVGQIFADTNITISADDDGYKILGFDKGASLQASLTGAYIINGSTINAEIGDIITNSSNKISIGGNTLSMEIDNTLKAAVLNGTDAADTISNFEASDVTINALGGDDQIINVDSGGVLINAGEGNNAVSNLLNYSTVTGASDFEGVSVIGGSGNDSIYNIGGNRASIVSGAGDDYISNRHGYYPTISAGDGNDFIRISNGHYQNIDAGAGNDTITADAEAFNSGDWAMGGYATLLGGDGNDLITPIYTNNGYIDGGAGDDTIITNGKDATITGGTGSNLISLTSAETDTAEGIVLALVEGENSTVEGFKGVSDGETDTLYFVDGVENKAVGFTSEGLSFWTDTVMGGSDYLAVTFPDISDTTLLNLVYGTEPAVVEAFVNDGDIYQASTGAADIYVGAVATHNQGVNFAGVGDATVTVDGLFGNGNINNIYTTIANFETLIGDNNMTFIFGGDTLTAADSVGTVTIKSSEDGTSTVAGTGTWNVNDSTVTLNSTSSLLSGESGLEVYTAGMIAYAAATLVSDPDNIIYSDAESLKGSGKNENIIVSNNRYLDISSGGEDTICLTNADTVTIKGYDVKTGSTFLTNTAENLTNLIMYGDPYLLTVGDGYFKADNLGKVVLEGTDTLNGTFVNFTVLNTNTTQLYGWSGQAGGNVDGSDYTQDAILIGVAPDGYSTLTGGAGNDTIYAAADDVVNLSSGNDLIDIDHLDREWRINGNIGGLTINLGSGNISANTTVKGFDNSVDKITVDDIGDLKLNPNDNNLQITVNDSTLTFEGITDTIMVTASDDTYTVHASDDNLTDGSAYYLETSDGTLETPDKGLTKKDNDYTYSTGTHTISGFNFGSTDDADELILNTEFNTVTTDSSGNLNITKDDDDSLQLTNAENQVIKVNVAQTDWTVEIGNNLTYDEDVNYYGGKDTATLSIGTVSADSVAIWTNGWDGKIYNNVKDIDGSAYSGQASLAGNALDNVITASSGNTSLWGSAGNDTLIGSNGYDEFFYTKGDGDDVITNAESTDLINLLDIKLEDISEISMNDNSVVATFKEGGQLTVNGTSEVNAVLADGTKWLSDKANKGWILKA